jgi:hypothetical protein
LLNIKKCKILKKLNLIIRIKFLEFFRFSKWFTMYKKQHNKKKGKKSKVIYLMLLGRGPANHLGPLAGVQWDNTDWWVYKKSLFTALSGSEHRSAPRTLHRAGPI